MNTPQQNTEARRLIESALDDDRAPALVERPAVRPDIAELLARHADEARHYRTTPYEPAPAAPVVKPSEPIPGWAKGAALAAPTVGGGVWIASQGVSGVMNAASPELAVCLAVGGLVVWLFGRSAAKRGPRKVVTNNDYRGATVNQRSSRGIAYKSNNG